MTVVVEVLEALIDMGIIAIGDAGGDNDEQ